MENSEKLDPRATFFLVLYISSFAIYFRDAKRLSIIFILALIFTLLMEIDLLSIYKKIRNLFKMIILVAILQGIFNPSGKTLISIFGIHLITTGGLLIGLATFFRMSILIMGGAMLSRYSNRVLIQAMIELKMPYELAYMVSVGIRFIPLSAESFRDSLVAIQLRGIDFDSLSFKERIDIYGYLLLPTIANGVFNSSQLAMAMELRGFRAYDKRTSFFTLKFQKKDYLFMVFIAFLFLGTIILQFI